MMSCAPENFNDEYRSTVCKMGQGAECCRYLTLGGLSGWGCAKHTSMAWAIDQRAENMNAKGDNCDGVYAPRPAFVLLKERFGHQPGTIVYEAKNYDYGLARDDERHTGRPHASMTLEPSGDYPTFTVPADHIAPATTEQPAAVSTAAPQCNPSPQARQDMRATSTVQSRAERPSS